MVRLLIVGAGGCLGAIARYLLSGAVHRWTGGTFPAGTLFVNVLGCLIIGAAMVFVEDHPVLGPNARLFLTIGLLGGFTTFSSFGYETVELLTDGQWGLAAANVGLNVVVGVGAVFAGRVGARWVGV